MIKPYSTLAYRARSNLPTPEQRGIMEFELSTLLLLTLSALGAGFIDAIAGGGGLITLPVLLSVGLSPTQALATNKLQASFGSFSATCYFLRRGHIDLGSARWAIAMTFIGSAAGTLLVQRLNAELLQRLLPFLLMAFALYFLLSPKVGAQEGRRRVTPRRFACTAALGIGGYDGFFGPGTGSFFALAYVLLAGYNLTRATAHSKLLNFTSNLAALLFFCLGGQVVWLAGLCMAAGQFIGARLGSRLVLRQGSRIIRPLIVTMSLALSVKLLFTQYGS